jgi:hypothetical protein
MARAKSGNSKSGNSDLPDHSVTDPDEIEEAVDVYVDAPVVKVDEIKFEMDDLRAHLAVLAEAGHFVQISAGVGVRLGKVELVVTSLERNPELLKSVGAALGDVGGGAHDLLTDTGDVIRSAGKGAGGAVREVGQGAGEGVAGVGQGAQQGVEALGQGGQ